MEAAIIFSSLLWRVKQRKEKKKNMLGKIWFCPLGTLDWIVVIGY